MSHVITTHTQNFTRDVLESPVPVVVDFYATWCPPCRMLAPVLDGLAAEFGERVRFVKVNIDEAPQLAQAAQISSVPTLLIVQGGKVVDRVSGAQPASVLRPRISRLLPAGTRVSA